MKESKENDQEVVYIPDEWIYDYTKTEEENKKSWEQYCKDAEEAWAKLGINRSK